VLTPAGNASEIQGAEPVTPLDLYKHAFVSFFPPQAQKTESVRQSRLTATFLRLVKLPSQLERAVTSVAGIFR
jgi:hypothetical protein